ncbi:MAG: NUDIX domain-containing protein [Promethearchaeota archaeon]
MNKNQIRARAIILHGESILLIKRIKKDRMYYVFPGGGIEPGEAEEEAIIRECLEELGIEFKPIKKVYHYRSSAFGDQIFFFGQSENPFIGTGNGPEYTSVEYRDRGDYFPQYVAISELKNLPVMPLDIRNALLEDLPRIHQISCKTIKEGKE